MTISFTLTIIMITNENGTGCKEVEERNQFAKCVPKRNLRSDNGK